MRSEQTKAYLQTFHDKFGSRLKVALNLRDTGVLTDYTFTSRLVYDFISGVTEGKLLKKLTDANITISEF